MTAASKGAVSASCVACGPPLTEAGAQPSRGFGGSVSGALLGFGHAMAFVAAEAKGDDMVAADDDDDEFASRNDIGFDADALAVATTLSATAAGACAAPTPRDASCSSLVDSEIKDADALASARNDTGDESGLTPMAAPVDGGDEFVAMVATLHVPRAVGGSEEEEPAAVVLLFIIQGALCFETRLCVCARVRAMRPRLRRRSRLSTPSRCVCQHAPRSRLARAFAACARMRGARTSIAHIP